MEIFFHTWHWAIAGFLIALVMLTLNYFGKVFGMSSNLRSLCTLAGGDKCADFFRFDVRAQYWNLWVLAGAMLGGFVATHYLSDPSNVDLNPQTVVQLQAMGIDAPQGKLLPDALFGPEVFESPKMMAVLLIGGLLIGFGSRYAGGCTSGHAIAGMSNLQRQSLKAVVGFFVGGLIMSHFILPLIF